MPPRAERLGPEPRARPAGTRGPTRPRASKDAHLDGRPAYAPKARSRSVTSRLSCARTHPSWVLLLVPRRRRGASRHLDGHEPKGPSRARRAFRSRAPGLASTATSTLLGGRPRGSCASERGLGNQRGALPVRAGAVCARRALRCLGPVQLYGPRLRARGALDSSSPGLVPGSSGQLVRASPPPTRFTRRLDVDARCPPSSELGVQRGSRLTGCAPESRLTAGCVSPLADGPSLLRFFRVGAREPRARGRRHASAPFAGARSRHPRSPSTPFLDLASRRPLGFRNRSAILVNENVVASPFERSPRSFHMRSTACG